MHSFFLKKFMNFFVHLHLTPINYAPIFFAPCGVHVHPVHTLATLMIISKRRFVVTANYVYDILCDFCIYK